MKKFFLTLALAASIVANAQEVEWLDVSALHFVATGGTDRTHALKQFLLIPEGAFPDDDPVLGELTTFSEEYQAMVMQDFSNDALRAIDEGIESLKQLMKSMPENKAEFENQIKQMEEMRKEALEQSKAEKVKFSVDPAKLLKTLTSRAVNKKPYSYYKDIGGGLFAVTEAPYYDNLNDSGYNHLDRPEDAIFTWGAIDYSGKTVIPAKYDGFNSFSPEEDFIRLFCKDAKGKVRCGIMGYDGRIRVPFIYDDEYASSSTGLTAFIKDGKFGLIDYDGKEYLPFEYSSIELYSFGWVVSKDGKTFGVVNVEGKLVVPMKYRCFWCSEDDCFKMERTDGRLDVFDSSFKLLRTEDKPIIY